MHETMTTLGKVFDRVEEMSRECKDRNVKVKDISFESLDTMRIGGETHRLREVAQRSICWRLGIPYHYLEKCPAALQRENMEHWIRKEKNDELFFRFDSSEVRAIFTTKYKPVDNFEVLERLDSIGYGPATEVQVHLDSEYMAISIPDGKQSFSVNKGDKITPGVSVSNSEVGLASLSVAAFFLRLKCTNGMIAKTEVSASYRHVSYKILSELPIVLEKISIELGAQKDKFRISTETKVEHPDMTMASFNRQFALNQDEKDAVEWGWGFEPGETMFHIVNAYTRAAQFEGLSAESSHRLQKVGGNILGMLKAK
ncbi:MAG: DUF932 domain-containing protein [Desulfobacteraceae bacterium]|nr:MAG: DUF932 domain-containing protein [Desulfobacteraceae bacterium]